MGMPPPPMPGAMGPPMLGPPPGPMGAPGGPGAPTDPALLQLLMGAGPGMSSTAGGICPCCGGPMPSGLNDANQGFPPPPMDGDGDELGAMGGMPMMGAPPGPPMGGGMGGGY